MGMKRTLFLSPHDITSIAETVGIDTLMDELIDRLHHAFIQFDSSKTQIPSRQGFSYSHPRLGLLEWMPILDVGSQMLMKMVGYHPQNPSVSGLPTILSTFSLYDVSTGELLAIVDGTLLTALRTGAASAVASRLMAKPESSSIGIVGCGAQAITQLHAMSRIFDVGLVRFYDIDNKTCKSFRRRCLFLDPSIDFIESPLEQIVEEVDIVCVATSIDVGAGPVFKEITTRPHLHINAVGSDFPGKIELPIELLNRSYVSPDCYEQAIKEGECQQLPITQIGKTLSQLLQDGTQTTLRPSNTVFDSTGWALEDYIATQLFLAHAHRLSIGQSLHSGSWNKDPKNPYEFLHSEMLNTSHRHTGVTE